VADFRAYKITIRRDPGRPVSLHIAGALRDGSATLHAFANLDNYDLREVVESFQKQDYDPKEMNRARTLSQEQMYRKS
jgi:hypothetical protein